MFNYFYRKNLMIPIQRLKSIVFCTTMKTSTFLKTKESCHAITAKHVALRKLNS